MIKVGQVNLSAILTLGIVSSGKGEAPRTPRLKLWPRQCDIDLRKRASRRVAPAGDRRPPRLSLVPGRRERCMSRGNYSAKERADRRRLVCRCCRAPRKSAERYAACGCNV